MVVGVGVGVGVGAGPPPFCEAGVYFFPGAPPFTLVVPPFLTLRSLRLIRFLLLSFAMGRFSLAARVGLAVGDVPGTLGCGRGHVKPPPGTGKTAPPVRGKMGAP